MPAALLAVDVSSSRRSELAQPGKADAATATDPAGVGQLPSAKGNPGTSFGLSP